MATERQIAANRRNARSSSGPRSLPGKDRASRNAYRHGLTLSITLNPAFAQQLEKLARKIAGATDDARVVESARVVAQAELELARVRRAKVELIARALASREPNSAETFNSTKKSMRLFNTVARGKLALLLEQTDPGKTMPKQEPELTAEAVRRALPVLLKLERYELRAASIRDRAVRDAPLHGIKI
jgi:hypothetical protein